MPGKNHFKKQLVDGFLLPGKKGKLLIINVENFNRLTASYPAAQIHLLQNKIKERIQSVLDDKALLGNFSESRYILYYNCNCEDAPSRYRSPMPDGHLPLLHLRQHERLIVASGLVRVLILTMGKRSNP